MHIADYLRTAIATLSTHKLRSSLTVLGLLIGNAAVIATIGIGEGAKIYTQQQLQSLGPNVLSVFPATAANETDPTLKPNLVLTDAEAAQIQLPAIDKVAPVILFKLPASYRQQSRPTAVVGTSPAVISVRSLTVASGRFFSDLEQQQNAPVVVLGPVLCRNLFGHQNPIGQTILIKQVSLQVIGVLQARGSLMGQDQDDIAFVPVTTMAMQVVGRQSPYGIPLDYIDVTAHSSGQIRAAAFQLNNLLSLRHGQQDFEIQAQKAFLDLTDNISASLSLMLAAIASISLLVGGIGIMNIMLVSVTERTPEIGLRKALGATPGNIQTQFLLEAVILALVGGTIGTGLGTASIILIALFTPLAASLSIGAIVLSLLISGVIGIGFGVMPARQAARLEAIVALQRL